MAIQNLILNIVSYSCTYNIDQKKYFSMKTNNKYQAHILKLRYLTIQMSDRQHPATDSVRCSRFYCTSEDRSHDEYLSKR